MKCTELWNIFKKNNLTFFTGVPDSTFKNWMSFLDDMHSSELTNRIAAIERDAVGWAAGYHIATGKIGVVYMQNSGLGNIVNPITSLSDPEVYGIPMLLMIGWRGEPGKRDELQHIKMGKITLGLLDLLGIKYCILPNNFAKAHNEIQNAKEYMEKTNTPYALIIQEGIIEDYQKNKKNEQDYEMKREDAIKTIIDTLTGDELIISTTGKTSRELFEYRKEKNFGHQNDFLMVGSMGLASSFGAELALQKSDKTVFVFDGDGALIMSAGALSTIGHYAPKNFYHIVFDNESHESTGGQPTASKTMDFDKLAIANGYTGAVIVQTKEKLIAEIERMQDTKGPRMLIVKIKKGARDNLGRPTITPQENKKVFTDFIQK